MRARRVITEDDLDEIEESGVMKGAEVQRGIAATLEAWATQSERYELDAGITPGDLLVQAADHAELTDDDDEVLRLLTLAKQVSGDEYPDGWIGTFVQLAKRRGELPQAIDAVAQWKARIEHDAREAFALAEAFELSGEFALAERWFTIAIRWSEREGEEWFYDAALVGRLGVRTEQGKPEDMMDVEAAEVVALRRRERGDRGAVRPAPRAVDPRAFFLELLIAG